MRKSKWLFVALTMVAIALLVGCGEEDSPTPTQFSSPFSSPVRGSVLPTPPVSGLQDRLLILVSPADAAAPSYIGLSDPDGSDRQTVADATGDPRSVAVSPNEQHIAFFTSPPMTAGKLVVWDVEAGETLVELNAPAEVTESFRDARPVRYLTWSRDGRLAAVIDRELYLVDLSQGVKQPLVYHHESQYNMAGTVRGSIAHPTWAADGERLVYDTWFPPEILSENADHVRVRNVEVVEIDSRSTETILEGALPVNWVDGTSETELLLQKEDGQLFSLDLSTLEVTPVSSPPALLAPSVCTDEEWCAAILSQEGGGSLIRVVNSSQSEVLELNAAQVGGASDCRFQSVLWAPGGDRLLATARCADKVSLWSVAIPSLEATSLADWNDAESFDLLFWFD